MSSIQDRIAAVRERMAEAARKSGRKAEDIELIAVSKGHPSESIALAYEAGQRAFGENYVQELREKASELKDKEGLVFHAIGSLQRNKVRDIVGIVSVIHTVDRVELALEIAKRTTVLIDVLIEVNVARESQKAGCDPVLASQLAKAIAAHDTLRLVGLMTIPPAEANADQTRAHFASLRELAFRLRADGHPHLKELSMGMSHDFEIAIEEGATMVRVGTAIFGERAPKV